MLTALTRSRDERVAAIAAKAVKEASYHVERSADTVIGLGDGTEESHARMQAALDRLWPYVGEMFNATRWTRRWPRPGSRPTPSACGRP
jgi:ring-1,2-phenylacetyl-CoA epoxidase subunit PaaC